MFSGEGGRGTRQAGEEAIIDRAEIFWTDDGQAVRLPDGYGFDADEVRIEREGNRIYLEPVEADPASAGKLAALRALIQEGLEGADEPWDVEEIKRFARDER